MKQNVIFSEVPNNYILVTAGRKKQSNESEIFTLFSISRGAEPKCTLIAGNLRDFKLNQV